MAGQIEQFALAWHPQKGSSFCRQSAEDIVLVTGFVWNESSVARR